MSAAWREWVQIQVDSHGSRMEAALVEALIAESAALVTDSDLTATTLTLDLSTTVLMRQPKAGPVVAARARLLLTRNLFCWL